MEYIGIAKVFIVVFNVFLILVFVYSCIRVLAYRPRFSLFTKPSKKILTLRDAILKERWRSIEARFSAGSPDSMKLALIEADKMTDDVLKRLGLRGQHMADRIEQIDQDEFPSLKRLWEAHRYRNRLVHTPDFEMTRDQATRAINGFRAFMEDVGVLK